MNRNNTAACGDPRPYNGLPNYPGNGLPQYQPMTPMTTLDNYALTAAINRLAEALEKHNDK